MARLSKAERLRRSLKPAAYHEAGHAVMALHIGLPILYVTIMPTIDGENSSLGHVRMRAEPKWYKPDIDATGRTATRIEKEVLVYLAGMAAQCTFTGRKRDEGWDRDIQAARCLAYLLHGDEDVADAYVDYMLARACSIVRREDIWAQINALALKLLGWPHKLNESQARGVCENAIGAALWRQQWMKSESQRVAALGNVTRTEAH